MARHYCSFCLSTQIAIFPLSCTPQRNNNGASFNLMGNASVEFWRCDYVDTRTYPRLYTVSLLYAVSFINYAYVADSSFGMHSAYVSLALIGYDEANLASKIARARARFTGVRDNYASLIRYRMLPFSPTRRRPSLRVLSPRSRPALGFTSLLADTHRVHDSIRISGYERETTYSHGYARYSRERVKHFSQ